MEDNGRGKISPQLVWSRYQKGVNYNSTIDLYGTVEENEEFFVGKQWGELYVTAPDLDKPVINFLQRVVSYFVSNITTDALGIRCRFFNTPKEQAKQAERIIHAQLEQCIEDNDLNGDAKDAVRDAAVDGDACYHVYFDPTAPSGQTLQGLCKAERISNTDVYFANRQSDDVERQPWIIIASRKLVEEVREIVRQAGGDPEQVRADTAAYESTIAQQDDTERVTLLTMYYRRDGTIWRYQCTQTAQVTPETDMEYRLYPIAWMPWEKQRGSYHGVSCITALKPNQIALNKSYAMALKQQRDLAYPKIIYNTAQFPDGWSNKIGPVGVSGDPKEAATSLTASADVPASVFTMVDRLLTQSREMMGASDASLGNVNPDNTSAIIAVQQATAMPLELKKRQFQQMVEKVVRSMLDVISCTYGAREICVADEVGNEAMVLFDWGSLKTEMLKLSVDIGDANYWDPNTQATMLERLLQNRIIPDPILFLEHMPDGLLKDKDRLIAQLKEAQNNAMQQMSSGMPPDAAGGGQGAVPVPAMQTGL